MQLIRFFCLGMFKLSMFILFLFLVVVLSLSLTKAGELLSRHNEEQAAKQAALDSLFDRGCIRTYMRRTNQFEVIIQNKEALSIKGYTVTIQCVDWGQEEVSLFTWSPPTQREDGTALLPEEISGYNIYVNGEHVETISDTFWVYILGKETTQPIRIAISTIDTAGRESVRTIEIGVNR